ncbi:hypothetical protein HDG36_005338 [Paraburkholderia sp. Kb1A]|nr:hypothetical protein [Paraburkholderia sp. Kb1A]
MFVELLAAMPCVDHRHDGVEHVFLLHDIVNKERLRDGRRIGKSRCLDDDPLEREFSCLPSRGERRKNAHQVATHRTTDTAIVHFDNLLVTVLHQQFVVDARFAELVFDDRNASAVMLGQDAVEQGRFSGAEEAGQDGRRDTLEAGCILHCILL